MNSGVAWKETLKNPLRVLLVVEDEERVEPFRRALQAAGCSLAAYASSSSVLAALAAQAESELIVIEADSPSAGLLGHLERASQANPRPIVMFTRDGDSEKIRAATLAGVSAYVVDGFGSERLRPILEAARARFSAFEAMKRKLESTELRLSEREEIERAKNILMKQRGWSEDQAYQAMRKMAMNEGIRLNEVARHVVEIVSWLR